MTYFCQTCGHPIARPPKITSIEALRALLTAPMPPIKLTKRQCKNGFVPHRNVYAGASGGYFVTHSPGSEVDENVVREAVAAGYLVPEWPGTEHEYWRLA